MKYAGIIKNDIANGPGVRVSFWVQGCPHKCYNCQNPETWNFDGGKEFTAETLQEIKDALTANGIQRNLSILGGEPLCQENLFLTMLVIKEVKEQFPNINIYLWTGYTIEELKGKSNPHLKYILNNIDVLIDGRYLDSKRDITLSLRGSSNQNIIDMKKFDFSKKI